MKQKAQTVSTDAFIAIALFMMVIIFFFSFSGDKTSEIRVKNLQTESAKLISALSSAKNGTPAFVEGTKVNIEKLKSAGNMTYPQLKDALGVDADFCIHFEDEKGDVINVTQEKIGLGSFYVIVGGENCG